MKEIKEAISGAKKIVVTAHQSPDGDAIGSSLALFHYLNKLNKKVTVIVPDAFPNFLSWMQGSDQILIYDKQAAEADQIITNSDLIFSLDYNGLNRIGALKKPVEQSKARKIVIDHHQDPQDFADYYMVDTDCCSTAQLIYELIEQLDDLSKLDETIGACIYCGIMTDTGSFRFPSTSAKTHKIVAQLINVGVNTAKIHQAVYDTNSENRLRLLGYALTEKMKVFPAHRAAYISLTQKELKDFSFKRGDTEGLVNYALSIDGVQFAILITEKENYVSLSLRSKDDFFVNKIAQENFNGGGHLYAAGGRLEESLIEVINKVEKVIKAID